LLSGIGKGLSVGQACRACNPPVNINAAMRLIHQDTEFCSKVAKTRPGRIDLVRFFGVESERSIQRVPLWRRLFGQLPIPKDRSHEA
jgi:hypothetical protein